MNLKYETLKKFGLKDNEIKVYFETLKHKELTPYTISKATKIPRTTVYDVLLGLSLKGLIEVEENDIFKKQQTLVRAKNPSVLRELLQKRRQKLVSLELDVLEILPAIKKDFHTNKPNADFKFYPGVDGARKIYFSDFDDISVPLYEWDFLMPMDAFGMDPVNKDVAKIIDKRKQQKHQDKALIPLNPWTKHVLTYQVGRDEGYLNRVEYRTIDDASFDVQTQIGMRGDYVKMVSAKADEVWGLSIKSALLVATLRSVFNQNWRVATPITLKMVKSWGENSFLKEEEERRDTKV